MAWDVRIIGDGPHDMRIDEQGRVVNEYQRLFAVATDAGSRPTESEIRVALGIYPGSPFENDLNATCYKDQIIPQGNMTYHVAVSWSTAAIVPVGIDQAQSESSKSEDRSGTRVKVRFLKSVPIDIQHVSKSQYGKLVRVDEAWQVRAGVAFELPEFVARAMVSRGFAETVAADQIQEVKFTDARG